MRLVIAEYSDVDGYLTPNLPPEASWSLLGDPYTQAWGLFDINIPDELWPSVEAVVADTELVGLIYSAKMYLPALVLAILEVAGHIGSKVEYLDSLKERLKFHLSNQRSAPYILARTRKTDGELIEGSWHWVLWYARASDRVHWASPYYCIYDDKSSCFDLSQQELESLPDVRSDDEDGEE